MPSITFDGRSFQLDGKRIWLVAGSIDYARVPAEQWADRLHAAKLAGLNTVYTPVVWSQHEPMPGQFDFKGDNDLRRFVELVEAAGLSLVLNLGPFIGAGWDSGGLPAWLPDAKQSGKNPVDMALRTANGAFLERVSKFITAVAGQIKDRQVTSPGDGGPIIMVQSETGWTTAHDALAAGYLRELDRFIREAGINVPVINDNNLWQEVEGQIDAWRGSDEMLAVMRQLASVKPDQPRLVIDTPTCAPAVAGEAETPADPAALQRRLAEILAGGGQYNLAPFHGAPSPGFSAGRAPGTGDRFYNSAGSDQAPLSVSGAAGASFGHVRRISTFASTFARVLANLEPGYHPVVLDPSDLGEAGKTSKGPRPFAVAHGHGSQGDAAFVFAPNGSSGGIATLLLPDGSSLPVDLGGQSVAWCLFNVHLVGRLHLDYCTFNAFTLVTTGSEAIFVCYGAPGSTGVVCVNGSTLEVEAPSGKTPIVVEHEGLTVVVCNEKLIDRTFVSGADVLVGVAGVNAEGEPLLLPGAKSYTRVRIGSKPERVTEGALPPARALRRSLSGWEAAGTDEYVTGQSPRFAAIAGPESLTKLGTPYGYGWYRLRIKTSAAKRHKLMLPEAGDRLHMFLDGAGEGLLGVGPGAKGFDFTPSFKKGQHDLVVLAENAGRFSAGDRLGEKAGLFGHIWEINPFRAGRASTEQAAPIDVLEHISPAHDLRAGDSTYPSRISWSFVHRKKSPIIMALDHMPCRALLVLNDEPKMLLEPAGPAFVVLDQETLNRGKNTLQIAVLTEGYAGGADDDEEFGLVSRLIVSAVSFFEGVSCLTESADWAFAKWESPAPSAFAEPAKFNVNPTGTPAWYRVQLEPGRPDAPLLFDPSGLTRGQLYLNGMHVGRYFQATSTGRAVPGQAPLLLPTPWLHEDSDNELLIFDEHGGNPTKTKIITDAGSVVLEQ